MNLSGTIRINRWGIFIICCLCLFILYYVKKSDIHAEGANVVNLRHLLISSIVAAEKGGIEIVKVHKSGGDLKEKSKGLTKEGANIPVTVADFNSHCAMYSRLHSSFPAVKVVSEEKEPKCTTSTPEEVKNVPGTEILPDQLVSPYDLVVWVDPLDATQEFTENILGCVTTMVCIAYRGQPLIGVIHFPFESPPQTYWAWQGRGRSRNFNISASLNETRKVIVSRSHPGEVEKILKGSLGNDIEIIHSGGAGFKTLQVVKGNAGAYIHVTEIKKWDICAGDAIMKSINGHFTTLDNSDIDYSDWITESNKRGLIATLTRDSSFLNKVHL